MDEHLQRLVAAWGMLADFCFADLLLFTPIDGQRFEVIGQVRPTTSQTLYPDDLVGMRIEASVRPQLLEVLAKGEIIDGQHRSVDGERPARVRYIPVRRGETILAVLTSEQALDAARRPGRLERTYLEIFDRLCEMVARGRFPFPDGDYVEESPRVGDGVIALDGSQRATFASPNAVSALHRIGTFTNAEGKTLAELGVVSTAVEHAGAIGRAVTAEVASGRVVLQLRVIPLADHTFVVLVRDVTDIRRRDRELITKDATIREVHHRVKNNLQTISALLRLQGRRLASPEAKAAIEESVRRIRSIALVHETLSRHAGGGNDDAVPFDDIVRPLARMVEEGLVSVDTPVRITVVGEAGDLAPEVATPLAVVLTELLQNAVEHGYPTPGRKGTVTVTIRNDGRELAINVVDDGVGLPDGFSPAVNAGLGLSIVRTLVTSELGGAIAFHNDTHHGGANIELRIPTHPAHRLDARVGPL